MSSSASSFEAVHKKLLENHKKQKERLNQYSQKHSLVLDKVWSLQMKCFVNGNKECIQKEKVFNGRKCVKECHKLKEGSNFDAKPSSLEELEKTKKFYGCITPCIEKIILDTNVQIQIVEKNIEVVSSFLAKD